MIYLVMGWTKCCFRTYIFFVIQLQSEIKEKAHMVLLIATVLFLKNILPQLKSYFVKL